MCFGLGALRRVPTVANLPQHLVLCVPGEVGFTILLQPNELHVILIVIYLVCISDALRRCAVVPPCRLLPPPRKVGPADLARRPPYITVRRALPSAPLAPPNPAARRHLVRQSTPAAGARARRTSVGAPRAPMYRERRRFRRFSRGALFVRSSFFQSTATSQSVPPCSATPSNPGSSRSCTASAASPCRSGIKKVSAPLSTTPPPPPAPPPAPPRLRGAPAAWHARVRREGGASALFEYDVDDESRRAALAAGRVACAAPCGWVEGSWQRSGEGLAGGAHRERCLRGTHLGRPRKRSNTRKNR